MSHSNTPAALTEHRLVLTVDEVAAALGMCAHSVRKAIREGSLPSVRIGRRMLVPRKQFEKLLEAQLAEASA